MKHWIFAIFIVLVIFSGCDLWDDGYYYYNDDHYYPPYNPPNTSYFIRYCDSWITNRTYSDLHASVTFSIDSFTFDDVQAFDFTLDYVGNPQGSVNSGEIFITLLDAAKMPIVVIKFVPDPSPPPTNGGAFDVTLTYLNGYNMSGDNIFGDNQLDDIAVYHLTAGAVNFQTTGISNIRISTESGFDRVHIDYDGDGFDDYELSGSSFQGLFGETVSYVKIDYTADFSNLVNAYITTNPNYNNSGDVVLE
jgi:hypothetical protein